MEGWNEISLQDLTSYVIGGDWGNNPEKLINDSTLAFCIRGSEIKEWRKNKGKTAVIRRIKQSSLDNRKLEKGNILIEISGGGPEQPVGRVLYIDEESLNTEGNLPLVCTNFFRKLQLVDSVCSKYVYYYLHYFYLNGNTISLQGGSNNLRNLKYKDYQMTKIPLPSFTEQKQISEKLDKLFDQIESIKKSTERIPELLKNFRQQILTYAVTGKLTERWREGNDLNNEFTLIKADKHRDYNYYVPASWTLLSFSNVVTIESNLVSPSEYKDYPLIAPDNIESMTGRILSKPTVAEIAPKSSKHYFTKDSLVYSKIRPYLSKIAYVDFDGLCSADMYPLKTKLNIFYLYYYMLSSEFLSFATTAGERIVLPKINQKSLNIIPIPVPPLKEQEEIVNSVQSLFTKLDIVEKRYIALCDILDNLPQAILNKAFKGKLL